MFEEHQCVERIDPKSWEEACSNYIVRQHSNRYVWAREFVKPWDRVIDVACGVGYGTRHLAEKAFMVYGIDCNDRAIKHARDCFDRHNIIWEEKDVFSARHHNIDVIVCFETIEHLEDDVGLIKLLSSWLKNNHILLISAPNESKVPLRDWPNGYHYRHYTLDSLEAVLKPHFEIVETKFQERSGKFVDKEDMIIVMQCKKRVNNEYCNTDGRRRTAF